jgi:hypothetical protein
MPYAKLPPGAKVTDISRTVYNRTVEMLEWWDAQFKFGQGKCPGVGTDRSVFYCKNSTGGDRESFDVVGLENPLFEPTENLNEFLWKTPLEGVLPDAEDHKDSFGILVEPCKAGRPSKVCVCGMVPVRLDVTDESDLYATIDDGDASHLVTGPIGVRIVWKDVVGNEDGNGNRWGLVLLGEQFTGPIFGKLKSDLAYNDTDPSGVDVDIYSDRTTDAGYDIEDVLPPPWMTEGTLASGSWVELKQWGGDWVAFPMPTVQTVTTDLQVDGPNFEFEEKTRKVLATPVGDESAWTVWHTGDDCED